MGGRSEQQYMCGESSMQQETGDTSGMQAILEGSDSKWGVNYILAVTGSSDLENNIMKSCVCNPKGELRDSVLGLWNELHGKAEEATATSVPLYRKGEHSTW